jgi:hypothetical protein
MFFMDTYTYKLFCQNSRAKRSADIRNILQGQVPSHPKIGKISDKGPSSTPVYLFQVLFMTKSHIDCDIKNNISINICVFSCDVIFSLFLSYTFFYSSQKYLTSRFGHFFLTIFSLFLS